MTWDTNQTIYHQGKLGTVIKVHTTEQLLAVTLQPGLAKAWPMQECHRVIQTVPSDQPWTHGQTAYWGLDGDKGVVVGWSPDTKQILWVTSQDNYYLVDVSELATTSFAAQRIAWFKEWGAQEEAALRKRLPEWEANQQWSVIALYWEHVASRRPLRGAELLKMAGAWRRSGHPVQALKTYQHARKEAPDKEPWILAGIAGCYRDVRNLDLAEETYQKLRNQYPSARHQASAALGLAGVARDRGDHDTAHDWWQEAQRCDPTIEGRILPSRRQPSLRSPFDRHVLDLLMAAFEPED